MKEKIKKVSEQGNKKLETLVDQYNELTNEIQSLQGRLAEIQTMLVRQQGYMECVKDIEAK
jgi:prefoldin subunit 5